MKVKIEGNRSPEELRRVAEAGADYAGVIVDVPQSPRGVRMEEVGETCSDSPIAVVLVFLNAPVAAVRQATAAARPAAVQLHGREPVEMVRELSRDLPCDVWKVVHLPPAGESSAGADETLLSIRLYADAGASKVVLDTAVGGSRAGGTGRQSDWDVVSEIVRASPAPIILAGGLTADNVAEAVRRVAPYGVDVASGVEREAGVKDWDAVQAFVRRAKGA